MLQTTICYIFDYSNQNDVKVLLSSKKKELFGGGMWNGYGGKVRPSDKSYLHAAKRETKEESKVSVKIGELEKVAEIEFRFTNAPPGKDWDQLCHIYFTKKWKGIPQTTKEMENPTWWSVNYLREQLKNEESKFWESDRLWLPKVLDGKKIYGKFTMAEDNKSIKEYKITETKSFEM